MSPPNAPVRRLGGLGTAALPRLLPLPVAAWYLGISLFSLRDVVKSGGLRPVPLPLPPDRRGRRQDGHLRKLLFDVRDLDELIEVWKPEQRSASASHEQSWCSLRHDAARTTPLSSERLRMCDRRDVAALQARCTARLIGYPDLRPQDLHPRDSSTACRRIGFGIR